MKLKCAPLAIVLLATFSSHAENWGHWRGPGFNGASPEKNLPATFSKTEHVKWVAELPGPAAATPVIWGEHVFVSSGDDRAKTLLALGVDRKSGKILWKEQVGAGYSYDQRSNFATSSPVTDGTRVVFLFANGELRAFDFAGKELWSRNLQKDYGPFAYQWTYGASPTIYDKKLFVQVLNRDEPVHGRGRTDGPIESYLLALDPETGKNLWKHVRPSEARMESHEAYSTPTPFEHNGRAEILIVGGDCVTGHSPKDGSELWRWGTWNPSRITHWRLVPTPVTGGGVILACAPKGSPIYAIKAGAKGGTQTDDIIAWKSQEREVSSDVATPVFYKGRFYVLDGDRRTITRIVPETGKAEWIGNLESRITIQSSPTAADDKIYFQNFRGEVFVIAAADQFKILHKASMGDEGDDLLRSSIAIAHGELFIRTGHKLYCVGL
jgi:outer membrane protein assembly factor BamB